MKSGHDYLQRADAAVWITIGVIAMAITGFALLGPFELDLRSFLVPGAVTALLAAGGWFYRSVRREKRLGAILSSTAHIIGFAAVGAPLSYVAATTGFPLQDAALDAIDRQLGIDWTQLMTFVSLHPGLQLVLSLAYSSFALADIDDGAGAWNRRSTHKTKFVHRCLRRNHPRHHRHFRGLSRQPGRGSSSKSSRRAPTVSCRCHQAAGRRFLHCATARCTPSMEYDPRES